MIKDFITHQYSYFYVSKYKELNKKTDNYSIMNYEGIFIGEIKWYAQWRKYCFFPAPETLWDSKCLGDVQKLLDLINEEYKNKKRGKEDD